MTLQNNAFPELAKNISYVEQSLSFTDDLKKQLFSLNGKDSVLLYIDSLVDQEMIQTHVLTALYEKTDSGTDRMFTTLDSQKENDLQIAIHSLIQGKCLYMVDGACEFYILPTEKIYARTINEPENEGVIRGPHNGFVEELSVNLNLIRKQIISSSLIVRYFFVGEKTRTKVAVVYLQDFTNPDIVKK